MSNSHPILLSIVLISVLCAKVVSSEQYAIVDSEKGDRLTGVWRGASDTYFEITFEGQVLRLPLSGYTIRFTSDAGHVPDRIAMKYFRNGRNLLELGLPELAKRRFESALEEFPKYADAHYQLGLLHKAEGNVDEALARFRSTAIIDAANFELVPLFREIGDIARADGDYAMAVNAYQLILTYYPKHESVQELSYRTGFLLVEQLQDAAKGLPVLESASKQFPNVLMHEKALFLIGKLQAETAEETEQLENALYTLTGFVQRYPESGWIDDARLERAIANLRLGRKRDAAQEAERILASSTDTVLKERASEILSESAWTVYTVSDGLPDNAIQTVTRAGTWLWIGTPKGIMPVETGYGSWTPMEAVAQPINVYFETVPDVRAIAANAEELWIGTRHQGLLSYNMETSEMQQYVAPTTLPSNWVRDIKMDDKEVWVATDAGVVRLIRESGSFLIYNTQNSFLPIDDIHTLALTPTTVWAASVDGSIATFNREVPGWDDYQSTEMEHGTTVVRFSVAAEQLLLTWFNAEAKVNGYFEADIDGANGQSTTLLTGIETRADLDDIYIAGLADNSPITEEEEEKSPVETPDAGIQNEPDSEFPSQVESEIETPLPAEPHTPLILWIATNDDVSAYYTNSNTWKTIRMPQTVTGESVVQSIVLINETAWIGTSNGLATINLQALQKP